MAVANNLVLSISELIVPSPQGENSKIHPAHKWLACATITGDASGGGISGNVQTKGHTRCVDEYFTLNQIYFSTNDTTATNYVYVSITASHWDDFASIGANELVVWRAPVLGAYTFNQDFQLKNPVCLGRSVAGVYGQISFVCSHNVDTKLYKIHLSGFRYQRSPYIINRLYS